MSERKTKKKVRALDNAPRALNKLVDDLTKAAKLKSPFVSAWFKEYCLAVIDGAMRKEGKGREASERFEEWKAQQSVDHLPKGVQWFLYLLRDTDELSMAHREIIDNIRIRLIKEEKEDDDFFTAIETVINCIRRGALKKYGEPIEGLSATKIYGKSTGLGKQKTQKAEWVDGIPRALRSPLSRN